MRVYRIPLHVSALRLSSEAEQVLQDLLLHSAHVQHVYKVVIGLELKYT
jgi:hypothetical protein